MKATGVCAGETLRVETISKGMDFTNPYIWTLTSNFFVNFYPKTDDFYPKVNERRTCSGFGTKKIYDIARQGPQIKMGWNIFSTTE